MCLTYFLIFHFQTVPNSKKLQTSTEMWLLTLSQTSPCFLRVCSTCLLKTLWEMEKLLVILSFSNSVFYPFCYFHKIQNCRLHTLSLWKSLEFIVREMVKGFYDIDCIENIVENGKISHFEHLHLFPRCFPEASFFDVMK